MSGSTAPREHLANERTHLAYVRTAVSLVSLGITVNRFSIYLREKDLLAPERPRRLLHDTEQVGLGMVVFGFGLMVLALFRFRRVEREIDANQFVSNRAMVELITLVALIGGALSLLWLFRR